TRTERRLPRVRDHPPGCARHRSRRHADLGRVRVGPGTEIPGDRDRLAGDGSPLLPRLAGAGGSRARFPGVPRGPPVRRVPLPDGSGRVAAGAPGGAVGLAPPPPTDRPIADVGAAVRDALRFPLAGPPLESLVRRGARVTILVESPALPIPAATRDPRQVAVVAAAQELERLGVPTDRQTILVAAGLGRRPGRRS